MPQSKKAEARAKKRAKKASEQHLDDPSHAGESVANNDKKERKKSMKGNKRKKKEAQLQSKAHLDASSGVTKSPKKTPAAKAPFGGDRGQPIVID